MKTLENFTIICNYDVSELAELCTLEQNWGEWSDRSKHIMGAESTEAIPFIWPVNSDDRRTFKLIDSDKEKLQSIINSRKGTSLEKNITRAVEELCKYRNGTVVRILLVKLKPHSTITPHIDGSILLESVHRCHLPIFSPKECIFTIGGESRNLTPGTWVEINNQLTHGVVNNSDDCRIHLLCDIMPQHGIIPELIF